MRVSGSRSASVVAGFVLTIALVCPASAATQDGPHPLIGRPSPELLQHLIGARSGNFRLSEHRGEVVLVGFWTSWCSTCGNYLERLAALDATYRSAGLVVAGVSLDDDPARAASALHAAGAKFASGIDIYKTIGRRFAVGDVPMTVLIDRDGIVRYLHGVLDGPADAALLAEIRQLLDE